VPIEVTGSAIVTRKGLRRARRAWPWLLREDVVKYEGDGGPFVDLVDETSLPMGTAVYDPDGPAPIRLLSSARTRDPVGLIHARLERALARREIDLDGTDAGRLCHGEADGIPGLFVDRFGSGLLVQVQCAPMAKVADDVLPLLIERTNATTVAVSKRDEVILVRGSDAKVRFVHGRLELAVDLATPGARTLSEDLERQRVLRRWARGRCLDLVAGFGGYGLQLAEGGATEVLFVDEPVALSRSLEDDAKHNEIEAKLERVEGDPLAWLRSDTRRQRFDVVVFHPRALKDDVDTETASARAMEHATHCLKLLDEGGILAANSTSTTLDDAQFADAMQEAAAKSRKRLQVLAHLSPGPDHPLLAGVKPPPSLLVARVLATA
jgi:23S rRNA (cytosine1962-C5)-methyltransferase